MRFRKLALAVWAAVSIQAATPSFEVASVKANRTTDPRQQRWQYQPGGNLSISNIPLYMIIAEAYDIPIQSVRLSGGPDWLRSERFDIQAKGNLPTNLSYREHAAKTRLMLQTLLADRFHLVMRRESKEVPVYALLIGKSGPKLQNSAIAENDCPAEPDPKDNMPCHEFMGGQGRGLHAKAVSMQDTVDFISNWTDRPVVDKTLLTGLYSMDTTGWSPMRHRPAKDPDAAPSAEDLAYADTATPTLFQIMEKLGLKLDPQKAVIEMFAIESAERPTDN